MKVRLEDAQNIERLIGVVQERRKSPLSSEAVAELGRRWRAQLATATVLGAGLPQLGGRPGLSPRVTMWDPGARHGSTVVLSLRQTLDGMEVFIEWGQPPNRTINGELEVGIPEGAPMPPDEGWTLSRSNELEEVWQALHHGIELELTLTAGVRPCVLTLHQNGRSHCIEQGPPMISMILKVMHAPVPDCLKGRVDVE